MQVSYVLMRNDLASQTPGRAAAQCNHAADALRNDMMSPSTMPIMREAYESWQNETKQGFGTCIVLGVNEDQMRNIIGLMKDLGYVAGIVHDPTYVLRDGDTIHLIPVDTCGYIFAPDKNDKYVSLILGGLPLF